MTVTATREQLLQGTHPSDVQRLVELRSATPHDVLGIHPAELPGRRNGVVVRAFHPSAARITCLPEGRAPHPMQPLAPGLFGAFIVDAEPQLPYRLRFEFVDGNVEERHDPYRFWPTLGDWDLHLFNEGTHRRLWEVLGARPRKHEGVAGTSFSVWAPNATRVSVVGDFCGWDGRVYPMRTLGSSGIFELFVPGVGAGALYKYEIRTQDGTLRLKTDPMAASLECPPQTASRVFESGYTFNDAGWMTHRKASDVTRCPIAVYEVHLGSFARQPYDASRFLGYEELAHRLVDRAARLGFTHVELLPIAEHAYYPSWGYQVTGFYAPTARYGSPDQFRAFVDICHQHGIGVILDWVPAHFPKDDFALRRFDGTALYEHEDPRLGEHPDWGTLIFNYGRAEVSGFLVSNALYWLHEFHVDGLRVDAVASMLYRDYSRQEGQWFPNQFGGRENLEAIDFFRAFNHAVHEDVPGAFTVAEESTAWPGVTAKSIDGGLGFDLKWNMGWMHDTLQYFARDPIHRRFHQNDLTFSMVYEHSERFVNPLSHDEVVHGKGSLLRKMAGDDWQQRANLRVLYAYQFTRPGKILLFMGSELAPDHEWNFDESLDWSLAGDPARQGIERLIEDLGRLYRSKPALWRRDPDPDGFGWLVADDFEQCVLAYARYDGTDHAIVVLNLTPVPRDGYRIGVPSPTQYRVMLDTDAPIYGGSGYPTAAVCPTDGIPMHGKPQSIALNLPPLSALVLFPED